MCNYGACINKQRKCDGSLHCADGSDEAGCTSTEDRITSTLATPTTQTPLIPSPPIYLYQTNKPTTVSYQTSKLPSDSYQTSKPPTQTNKNG